MIIITSKHIRETSSNNAIVATQVGIMKSTNADNETASLLVSPSDHIEQTAVCSISINLALSGELDYGAELLPEAI
jgi:hypothetical protein